MWKNLWIDMKVRYLAVLIVAAAVSGCNENGRPAARDGKLEYAPEVNKVEVITLKRTDFPKQVLSNGKLSAAGRASLKFRTIGPLSEINVENGGKVASGAVIARVDRPDLHLALQSAEIALEKAEFQLYDVLAGQGYQAKDTISVPKDVLAMAKMKSGYNSSVNALERAKYDLEGTVLKAPFSGRVADLKLKKYDNVSSDVVCTLLDDSRMDVLFTVMESEYSFVQKGLTVKVIPFADESRSYTGKVTDINPVVDKNGQVTVSARIPGNSFLADGMNVKVIVEKTETGKLVVPRSAVVIRDNLDVLFTYTPDGKAHWVYVNILDSNSDSFVIEANADRNAKLSEGEQVIISSNLNLADGSAVTLK